MTRRNRNNVCMGERRREEKLGPEEENGKRWTEAWESERAASIRESEGRWARALSGRGPGWAKRGVVSLQNRAEPLQHHEIRQVPGGGTSQGS